METWNLALEEGNLPEGAMTEVSIYGRPVLLLRVREVFYALDGRCPHLGCPLARGTFKDGIITCPCHDWRFYAATGRFVDAPEIGVAIHKVRVTGDSVFVSLNDKGP